MNGQIWVGYSRSRAHLRGGIGGRGTTRLDRLPQEAEFVVREVSDVGKYLRQAGRVDSEPLRQRRTVLVDRRRGNNGAARVGVVHTTERQQREVSIHLTSHPSSSDDEVVIAPGVVAAVVAAGIQGASKFGS